MNDGNETAAITPRSLASALDGVNAWRQEQESKTQAELAEVDSEIESVKSAIANLTQQLDALHRFRDEVSRRTTHVSPEETTRRYQGIFTALLEQHQSLTARSALVRAATTARDQALLGSLADPAAAALVRDYEQFRTAVAPTLGALPESYRAVILQHHESVTARLKALVESHGTSVAEVDAPTLTLDVALAIDTGEGAPDVLMMVVPVSEHVNGRAGSRPEDAETWIAARVLQGLYEACAASGLHNAHAAFGGHQGLLAIEIEVPGVGAEFATEVAAAIARVVGASKELRGAKVSIAAHAVPVDHLLPPETSEEADDVG